MIIFQYIGGIVGLGGTSLMIYKIKKKEETEQNFVSWFLCAILDAIVAISTITNPTAEGYGNWFLPVTYTLGALCICFAIYKYGGIKKLDSVEYGTIIGIIFCLFIWIAIGNISAIIVSTTIICLSWLPQMKDTWNMPLKTPTLVYVIWGVAEFLSFVGGKTWTVEERFYAGVEFVIGLVVILFSLRKYRKITNPEKLVVKKV